MYKTIAPLVLASQSPRRQQLLKQLGIEFTVATPDIVERQAAAECAADFVARMASEKAAVASARFNDCWVLAADTIVVVDGEILGKPLDAAEAVRMLTRLSGRWHQVFTAFCLSHSGYGIALTQTDVTRVRIASLPALTVAAYVASGEPLDKAGSYALQGQGGAFVEALDGCHTTVIGLPLPQVLVCLCEYAVIALV